MAINELIEGYVSCQEAKVQGLKRYFTGKPCKHGHITERYVKDKTCIICSRAHKKKYAQTEQAKEKAKKNWTQKKMTRIFSSKSADSNKINVPSNNGSLINLFAVFRQKQMSIIIPIF